MRMFEPKQVSEMILEFNISNIHRNGMRAIRNMRQKCIRLHICNNQSLID